MTADGVALSVKQPWAALLVAGQKAVEVRTWPTARRGTVFLHAAKVPDSRPHGWTFVDSPDLVRAAELVGGIVAVAELVDCVTYPDAEAFAADVGRHRNLPSWFRAPRLYGFVFADLRPVPFHPVVGNTFFFPVSGILLGELSGPHPARLPSPSETVVSGDEGRGLGGEGLDADDQTAPVPQSPTLALPPTPATVIIIDPPEGKGRQT